jgi:hypothetical protein
VAITGAAVIGNQDDTVAVERLDDLLAQHDLMVQVEIDGEPVDPGWTALAKDCAHSGALHVETVVAFIREGDGTDLSLPVLEWQCRLRALCAECGLPFDIAPTGRIPRDGKPGVVVAMRPSQDPTI